LCPVCNGPRWECQEPKNAGRFIPQPPVRCNRATAIQEQQKGFTEEKGTPAPMALLFSAALKGEV
jgi:hypothetical protein